MRFDAFIGGSFESQAKIADCERTINWYPELLPSPGATSRRILLPTPGVEVIVDTLFRPGRAHFAMGGREFSVNAGRFCEFSSTDLIAARQTTGFNDMAVDFFPATIHSNGDAGGQLFITTGGNAYVFDLSANTLTGVTPLVGQARFGGMLDGFFLALDTETSTLHVSDLNDGMAWTMFARRSLAADPWLSMRVLGRGIWLLGEQTSEVWYNTGDRFPFTPHPSGLLQYGILAPWSAVIAGDSLLWLAGSRSGRVCVMRVSGVEPEIVSPPELEKTMAGYLGLKTAVADAYSENGHTFYRLNFDVDGATWVYDLGTRLWHEQGAWVTEEGRYVAARQRFHAYAFGEHRILDSANGNLYRMSQDLPRDVDARLIRRMRRAPAISDELKRVYYPEFELDLETGLAEQDTDPQVMLRVSNDAAKNWVSERWRSAGKTGEYLRRVRWTRCGSARRRVFEVSVSDPVPWRVIGAYLRAEGITPPGQRRG